MSYFKCAECHEGADSLSDNKCKGCYREHRRKNMLDSIDKQGPYVMFFEYVVGGMPNICFKNISTGISLNIQMSIMDKSTYTGTQPFETVCLPKKYLEDIIYRLQHILVAE